MPRAVPKRLPVALAYSNMLHRITSNHSLPLLCTALRANNGNTAAVTTTLRHAMRCCSSVQAPLTKPINAGEEGVQPTLRSVNLVAHGVAIAELRRPFAASRTEDGPDAIRSPSSSPTSSAYEGQTVTVRARLERSRGRGKLAFLHLRQPPLESIQAICEGKALASAGKAISLESIIDVTGVVRRAATPVSSTTCPHCELQVTSINVVSAAATPLPFPYHDANTKLDTRLNHRVMDLRTPRMVAIARLVSALGQSFRHELLRRNFIEVHTPKLSGSASEGGSNVFSVDYFGKPAYLAQSPQLYKQMLLMGDAMRVFEVGPVFRAEKSLTHRHLTEFVGLDGEMVIQGRHTEVLDVLEPVLCAILADLLRHYGPLIDVLRKEQAEEAATPAGSAEGSGNVGRRIRRDHALQEVCCEVPVDRIASMGIACDPLPSSAISETSDAMTQPSDVYGARIGGSGACRVLRLRFASAAQLLTDKGGAEILAGCDLPLTDFTLPQERRLGELIHERYGVDLYVVDAFPAAARPFYTMPMNTADPDGPTRSYDVYLRGEEICSGAQRIADVALLEQRLRAKAVDPASVADYVDSFRYGAWPHGGFGLGLERIVLFFLGLEDIRQVSLFPRDPKRIAP